jgi:hypothetical protein
MKLTSNKITDEKVKLTSWKTLFDPSIGSFTLNVERLLIPEVFNSTILAHQSVEWYGFYRDYLYENSLSQCYGCYR